MKMSDRTPLATILRPGVTELIGTTGSGKTEAIRVLIAAALRDGRGVRSVVPEWEAWIHRADMAEVRPSGEHITLSTVPDMLLGLGAYNERLSTGIKAALATAADGDLIIIDACTLYDDELALPQTETARKRGQVVVLCGQNPSKYFEENDAILLRHTNLNSTGQSDSSPAGAQDEAVHSDLRELNEGEGFLLWRGGSERRISFEMRHWPPERPAA